MPALQTQAPPVNLQAVWERYQPSAPRFCDASSLHPVFFTGRLRRSPAAAPGPNLSPVAHGYVYNDERRRPGGPML
ncbi:hypothetical protein GGS20DRAFT_544712 [Poronia punctata]|nr:hypothetical protein GGS20DRAFT_544712 [Poronia punctata]